MKNIFLTLILFSIGVTTNASLLRNGSFETVPGDSTGQGLMPSEWLTVNSSPDTYSNDGSYGLFPDGFGNFTGVIAHDGNRWVAGWSVPDEQFGQLLTAPLSAGISYTLSAYMIQSVRIDLDHPGGYNVYLTSDASGGVSTGVLLGSLGATADLDTWALFSLTFTAPGNAADLPFLLFSPFGDVTGSAYTGIDSVNLQPVPVPAAVWLLGSALLCLRRRY